MMKTIWLALTNLGTTIPGVIAVLAAITLLLTTIVAQFDNDPNTIPDWNHLIGVIIGLATGWGLIKARASGVSSIDEKMVLDKKEKP